MTQFAYESANDLFAALHKPEPVSPRVAAVRDVLSKATAGVHRDRVADVLYRQAESPDEISAILRVRQELDDTEKHRAETELRESVAKSLSDAERRAEAFPAERRSDESVEDWHARLDEMAATEGD